MVVIEVFPLFKAKSEKELLSKCNFDTVQTVEKKVPEPQNSGKTSNKIDSAFEPSGMGPSYPPILPDTPNSYKRRGVALSRNFVQLSRSEDTSRLLQNHPKAFLLLTYIALHATRKYDAISELEEGECFLSREKTPKECGLTEKEFRGAKDHLMSEGIIIEVYNPTWFRKKNGQVESRILAGIEKFKKRAIKRAIKCIVVKLCVTDVYDINLESKGHQKGHQRASKGPSKGHIQEGKEEQEDKKTDPLPPKGGVDVSFSKSKKEEQGIHVHREVFMSAEDLKECIESRGSLEIVKAIIDKILEWPDRKFPIRKWKDNIKKWTLKNSLGNQLAENEEIGKTLEKQFSHISQGWALRHYRDRVKDDSGLLFECIGSSYSDSIFISYSIKDFRRKVDEVIKNKKMKPRN